MPENKLTNADMQLSDQELNEVIDSFKKDADKNQDITHLRDIQDSEASYLGSGLVQKEASFPVDEDGNPNYIMNIAENSEPNEDADKIIDSIEMDDEFKDTFVENATSNYDMSDEDAAKLLDAILAYKQDKKANVYTMFPQPIKDQIMSMCRENNIPLENRWLIAKEIAEEFIMQAAQDKTFNDFEVAMSNAMKIPSITDLYNEHLSETMDYKLKELSEAIKQENPDKAQLLLDIRDKFAASMTYSHLMDMYENNARIRKLVRKDFNNIHDLAANVNHAISNNNKFNMPDATTLKNIINKVIIFKDPCLTKENTDKFLCLLFNSILFDSDDPNSIVTQSYMYYLLKNISMLNYSNTDARSSFSSELIINIKTMMYYIMAREDEFHREQEFLGRSAKGSKRKNS